MTSQIGSQKTIIIFSNEKKHTFFEFLFFRGGVVVFEHGREFVGSWGRGVVRSWGKGNEVNPNDSEFLNKLSVKLFYSLFISVAKVFFGPQR
jgi:hypothetical protein